MLGGMPLSLIVGPPNSGRAGEIRAPPRRVARPRAGAGRTDGRRRGQVRARAGLRGRGAARRGDPDLPPPHRRDRRGDRSSGSDRCSPRRSVSPWFARSLGTPSCGSLAASRRRPGFAPALDRLLSELQAALVAPEDLAAAARELDDGEYEAELAGLYAAYRERREGAGRDDAHSAAAAVASSLRERPDSWGARPVLVYGFDDLTEEQLDLLSAARRRGRGDGCRQLRGQRCPCRTRRAPRPPHGRARGGHRGASCPSTPPIPRARRCASSTAACSR